jgi:sugar lactone lactonase YvrE/enterochelin esterase-like enzyme
MKTLLVILFLLFSFAAFEQAPAENYPEDSASIEHSGVPKGEVLKFAFENSKIFPGTWREYWVYVPAQYRSDKPACVYVNQDGIQWKAPTVFDNLIHNKEMPVTIGIFVTPGRVRAANAEVALDRFNRSFEYDGLGDAYARFILEEILPDVEKKKAGDGRIIRLSKSGNDRAVGGSSSGAVCAFTAAWERPQEFSRVFSAIGTYVGLRGADRYPTLIRKYEPKPLRIFLQDGSNDNNIYAGDWWKANETMERALTFSGYEVNHVWGEGTHNGRHGTAIFPEAMRWLWKDWPKPVEAGNSKNQFLSDISIPGEDWELVGQGYKFTEGTAVNAKGEVFYQDIPNSKTFKIDVSGKPTPLNINAKKGSGTAFSADGKRYVVANERKQILTYDLQGKETVFADNIPGNDLVITNNGNLYVTAPDGTDKPSKIYLIKPDGKKIQVDEGLKYANGITLTPDQTQMYVTESTTHWIWVYQIQPDGMLANKQHYGWLHVPDTEENAWADGIKCDTAGRVYVATNAGIQVLDQTGRVNAILPIPGGGQPSNLCFGGADFNTMYVSYGDKVYRRKLKVRGANAFDKPVKPKAPRL